MRKAAPILLSILLFFLSGCHSAGPDAPGHTDGATTKPVSDSAIPDPDRPPPELPGDAVMLGNYGNLELTIIAARDGTIVNVRISKASKAKIFDEPTRTWVEKKWKMPPAKTGEPELRTFIAPIEFPKGEKPPGGKYPDPPYPQRALAAHEQGRAMLAIKVGEDGIVESAKVLLSSGHESLDKSTVEWVQKKWVFPAGKQRYIYWMVTYQMR